MRGCVGVVMRGCVGVVGSPVVAQLTSDDERVCHERVCYERVCYERVY